MVLSMCAPVISSKAGAPMASPIRTRIDIAICVPGPREPSSFARSSAVSCMFDPRPRDEEIFVEADGVAIGHAGEEIARRGIEPLALDGRLIQKIAGPRPHSFPQAAEDARRLAEL